MISLHDLPRDYRVSTGYPPTPPDADYLLMFQITRCHTMPPRYRASPLIFTDCLIIFIRADANIGLFDGLNSALFSTIAATGRLIRRCGAAPA